jgi:hypothetical protein
LEKPLHLFETGSTYQHRIKAQNGYHFPADAYFAGESKPYGAMISYSLNPGAEADQADEEKREKRASAKIEILDAEGTVISKLDGSNEKGINRIFWRLRRDVFGPGETSTRSGRYSSYGPEILPGTYTVRITYRDVEETGSVNVLADPRENIPMADRRQKYETIVKLNEQLLVAQEASRKLEKMGETIDKIMNMIKESEDDSLEALQKQAEELRKELKRVGALFYVRFDDERISYDETAIYKLRASLGAQNSSWDKPNPKELMLFEQGKEDLRKALVEYNTFFAEKVADFREKVEESGLSLFFNVEKLNLDWKPDKVK